MEQDGANQAAVDPKKNKDAEKFDQISNKMIAEKMIERNMQNNVDMLKKELNTITGQVRNMMSHCDK